MKPENQDITEKVNHTPTSTTSLLEKLSHEISRNFEGENNSGIYYESIKRLLKLKESIDGEKDIFNLESKLSQLSSHLSDEKKHEFYLAIKGAKEILKNSQDLIEDIKDEINIFTPVDGKFTTKIFGQSLVQRGKKPLTLKDQFIGGGIGLSHSTETLAKISVNLLVGIGKTIPDLYKIASGKAKYDGFKNI